MPINEAIYQRQLRLKGSGVFRGEHSEFVEVDDENLPWDAKIIEAFLSDDDIQEITIVSANIGFVKTLTKQYRKDNSDDHQ